MYKLGGSPYGEFSNLTADMLEQKLKMEATRRMSCTILLSVDRCLKL